MKVLTLRQPWASLVALGVKRIETRSWATSYRGPIAIHAGKQRVRGPAPGDFRLTTMGSAVGYGGMAPVLRFPDERGGGWVRLPLGAIVATATLADVVPIVAVTLNVPPPMVFTSAEGDLIHWCSSAESRDTEIGEMHWGGDWSKVTDQLPYGDFTPGRFAWLLEDVKPTTERCPACWGTGADPLSYEDPGTGEPPAPTWGCEACGGGARHGSGRCGPVPYRGHQGLRDFDAERIAS